MISDQLWRIADDLRNKGRVVTLPEIIRFAKAQDVTVTLDHVRQFAPLLGAHGQCMIPSTLVDVCVTIAALATPQSVLDPWAGVGSLIIPVACATGATTAVAVNPNREEVEAGAYLSGETNVEWHADEPLSALAGDARSYDLIVSCPPFGHRSADTDLTIGDVRIRDDYGNQIIAAAVAKLSGKGLGIAVITPSTILSSRSNGLVANLERLGLSIDALLHLPNGFFPTTAIDAYVALISRNGFKQIFVGEIRDLHEHNELLLRNLERRIAGEDLSLGRLVDRSEFKGYRQEESRGAIGRLAQRSGLESVALVELVEEINLTKGREPSSFAEKDNAVYLPLIGKSRAVTSTAEFTLLAHNYAQIVLDEEKVFAPYMASYFNSVLGRLGREQILSGTFIPKITKQSLRDAIVYIPDIATQRSCMECDSKATNLVSEVEAIRESMWTQPRTVRKALSSLDRVNKDDNLKVWIDSMPFPLASILWAYHASGDDDRERSEHLLHFFEALAEFHALVLWSAIRNSSALVGHAKYPFGKTKPLNYSLENSSFGSWVEITARLARFSRTLMNSQDEPDRESVFAAFRTRNPETLRMLCSSKIVEQIQSANAQRNKVRHGGIPGADDAKSLRILLESSLANVRSAVGNTWEEMPLMKAGPARIAAGVFHYEAELVMGRSTPFERRSAGVTAPIDDGRLFLLASDSREPIVLEPLLIVAPSPRSAENACYFYNSAKNNGLRFVSYHFRGEPEIIRNDESAVKALAALVSVTEGVL